VGEFGVTVKALSGKQFAVGCGSGNVRIFNELAQVSVIAVGKVPIFEDGIGC
jgi:hypothetical protein